MSFVLMLLFIIGYLCIAFEHPLKIPKAATALFIGAGCWLLLGFGIQQMPVAAGETIDAIDYIPGHLAEHLGEISAILFFLLGAMMIVELIDVHHGFQIITDKITTRNKISLLWIISWVTFFLSAVLDNLTTAIVLCALLRKIIPDEKDRWWFGGFVIIAANAGGAWSPIGDVTTIMLWIGGQVTALNIVMSTFAASFFSLLIPLLFVNLFHKKELKSDLPVQHVDIKSSLKTISTAEQNLILFLGVGGLLFIPVFKTLTPLPPYMGMLLVLSILWIVTSFLHHQKDEMLRRELSVAHILQRIDSMTILFFLGILLAVAALETSGHLDVLANMLDENFKSIYLVNTFIGFLSAIIDNVPLVAASMGMYDLARYPADHDFWELLAYCAGTGGSMLIIGSAAGVATMGLLKMEFMWYLKRISVYALIGYIAGIGVYYIQHQLL